MEIKLTLKQAKWLVDSLAMTQAGGTKFRALNSCIPILEQSLLNNVFRKPHSDTLNISDKAELQALIRSGSKHKPASGRPGKAYSQEYLDRKYRLGEHYPHKYMEYGFWQGIDVDMSGGSLLMQAEEILTEDGFSYMVHHAQRRSVLKRAFLDAWQDIVNQIIKFIADEAQGK